MKGLADIGAKIEGGQPLPDLGDDLVLDLLQQIVLIPVMGIKGTAVDVRPLTELFDGNLCKRLLLHPLDQALFQDHLCIPRAPVAPVCVHTVSSFLRISPNVPHGVSPADRPLG